MSYAADIHTRLSSRIAHCYGGIQGNAGLTASTLCKAFLSSEHFSQKELTRLLREHCDNITPKGFPEEVAIIDFDHNHVDFSLISLEEYAVPSNDPLIFERVQNSGASLVGFPRSVMETALAELCFNRFSGKSAEFLSKAIISCTIEECAGFFQPS